MCVHYTHTHTHTHTKKPVLAIKLQNKRVQNLAANGCYDQSTNVTAHSKLFILKKKLRMRILTSVSVLVSRSAARLLLPSPAVVPVVVPRAAEEF